MEYKDYNEYLLSDKWQQVKDNFKNSIKYENVCYLCFERTGLQLHHWRYEKDWNLDTHNNVIQLCSFCHKAAHQSEVLHNSSMYGPKDLYKYLSHLIKDLKLMEYKHIEFFAVDFIPEEKSIVVEKQSNQYPGKKRGEL